jgi:acetyl esterase/lipase
VIATTCALSAPGTGVALTPNSGEPGAPCTPVPFTGQEAAPDPTLDAHSLGPRAPAAYEIGPPAGGRPARRVLILIHGGAWYVVGRAALEAERSLAAEWRAAGWETVSITYRGCEHSIGDALRFYDLTRERAGPATPICALGQSAGGHLALTIAARRPDLACAISYAGPSDLVEVERQGREQARTTGPPGLDIATAAGVNVAKATFPEGLAAASPITQAAAIRARVLAATATDDVLIPGGQDRGMVAAIERARPGAHAVSVPLRPGGEFFVHGTASPAALAALDREVAALVAPFGPAPRAGRALVPRLRFALAP